MSNADRTFNSQSDSCPKEGGVILTPYNTIALGSVISAIAAGLEPQKVKPRLLLDMPVEEDIDEIEFIVPREQIDRSIWQQSMAISEVQIDNVWIATISGWFFFFIMCFRCVIIYYCVLFFR